MIPVAAEATATTIIDSSSGSQILAANQLSWIRPAA